MSDLDLARAHIAEIAQRAEDGDEFCTKTLAAIVILLAEFGGGDDYDGDGLPIDNLVVLDLFRRAA